MFKSFFEVIKSCVGKNESRKLTDCNVDELGLNQNNENTLTGTITNSNRNFSISDQNNFNLILNDVPIKKMRTFGLEDSNNNITFNSMQIEFSDITLQDFNNKLLNDVKISLDESSEESSRKNNKQVCNIRDFNKNLLFTIKDPCFEEMSERVFSMNNIVILDSEILQSKKLTVVEDEGDLLKGQFLVIDASGLINSLRKRRDGFVFFGPVAEYKNCIINDFVINLKNDMLCKTRLFAIFYERKEQKYYLRNLNDSGNHLLMYIKITKPFQISKKIYISLNNLMFSIQPQEDNIIKVVEYSNSKFSNINNNTLTQNTEENNKIIHKFEPNKSPITIGRNKCSITYDYTFLSKKHCTIIFNKEQKCWFIQDGNDDRKSTNGTWMLLKSKYEINDTTIFKVGNSSIKINVV